MNHPVARAVALLLCLLVVPPAHAGSWEMQLVTRQFQGDTANAESHIKATGGSGARFLLVDSAANNLTTDAVDENNASDVWLYDSTTGAYTLVSHAANAPITTGNQVSNGVAVSADGRWVLLQGKASDLVAGAVDTNGTTDVFLYDHQDGSLRLVSHRFDSATTAANAASRAVAMSDDGRWIIFNSDATDLASGVVDAGTSSDVFLYDRDSDQSLLVSSAGNQHLAPAGAAATATLGSSDGRYVVFTSASSLLVAGTQKSTSSPEIYQYDRLSDTLSLVSHWPGQPARASDDSEAPIALSADGDWLLFNSTGLHVVSGGSDANSGSDVLLYQRSTDTTTLVSHAASTLLQTGDRPSLGRAMTPDGRWILYASTATNLVSGVVAGTIGDAYVFDRNSSSSRLVSHHYANSNQSVGGDPLAISADGGKIALRSSNNGLSTVPVPPSTYGGYVYDTDSATVTTVTVPARQILQGSIGVDVMRLSPDGSQVFYESSQPDLLPGVRDSNALQDDVVRMTLATSTSTLLSRATRPAPAATTGYAYTITSDLRYVSLSSNSAALVADYLDPYPINPDAYLTDLVTGSTRLVSHASTSATTATDNYSVQPRVSADGSRVAFGSAGHNLVPGMTDNGYFDTFLFDTASGGNSLVSHLAGAPLATAHAFDGSYPKAISSDGRWCFFESDAPDLVAGGSDGNADVDLFLYDADADNSMLVSHAAGSGTTAGNALSKPVAMTPDAAFALFNSDASNLGAGIADSNGASDVFVFDRGSAMVSTISLSATQAGRTAAGSSSGKWISPDGRFVLLDSTASDLVPGATDANAASDVVLVDRSTGMARLVSHAAGNPALAANGTSIGAMASDDGRFVLFSSTATDLVAGVSEGNVLLDVFLADLATGATRLLSHAAAAPSTTGNGASTAFALSSDGRFALFESDASNLDSGIDDVNGTTDLYVYDRVADTLTTLTRNKSPANHRTGNGSSRATLMTSSGGAILFRTLAKDLMPGIVDVQLDSVTFLARYKVTATPSAGPGTIFSPAQPQRVDYRSAVNFTVGATPGYTLANVSGCGSVVSNGHVVIAAMTEDCVVTATATPIAGYLFDDGFE